MNIFCDFAINYISINIYRTSVGQIIVCLLNILTRIILTLFFINRYPRQNLNFTTFPLLNIVSSLTFSIRVYESLELGDNKEYDGYRYYRSWMWSSFFNIPFEIIALILVIVKAGSGSIALSVLVLVGNLLNVGRCFLGIFCLYIYPFVLYIHTYIIYSIMGSEGIRQ